MTTKISGLTLECLAVGSLPYVDLEKAMDVVKENFETIPFWPQLTNLKEDMINQFNMSSFCSASFPKFIELLKKTKPKFAKGQLTGPYTLSTELKNDNIIENLIKIANFQIKQIKYASKNTIPIIFIDEPDLANLNGNIPSLNILSNFIKQNGAICGIHCCGAFNWNIPINSGANIISFDAYNYMDNFLLYHKEIKNYLENNGKIAWGIVPTDNETIKTIEKYILIENFEKAVNYLTKNGIDEKIIIENSMITQSCGAGKLNEELASKAMKLTKEISHILQERYYDI